DLLKQAHSNVPTMLRYQTHVDKNSLYNTPPTFGIYMLGEVLNWIQDQGGLNSITEKNIRKANLIYKIIDESDGFYTGHAQQSSSSYMNITFILPYVSLEKQFLFEAKKVGLTRLYGQRSF